MAKNNRNIIVAVKGVIINEGKILLVQRASADAVGGGTWECAGGKIEFGEGLEDALVREIKEETGLTVTVDNLLYAASFLTDPARQVIIITYLCRSAEQVIRLSEEHTDYRWCTKDLLHRLLSPQIFAEFVKYHILELEDLQ